MRGSQKPKNMAFAGRVCRFSEFYPHFGLLGNLLLIADYFFDILFCLVARYHNFMPAAGASEPEIHAYAKHLKALAAAGVILFHLKKIA